MNDRLQKAMFDMEKVKAMMYAVEPYLTMDGAMEERELVDRGGYLFYALWDAINMVADDLELLSGDCLVVDAIYAVNDVRQKAGTLKTER